MAIALYHPSIGYYCRDRARVGTQPGTDFFTASSLGPVFGELVLATVLGQLRQRHETPDKFTFVEIGAEAGRTVLDQIEHPFARIQPISVGEPLDISGPCIVFSNELFDAQPCARFVQTASGWAEIGVKNDQGRLVEVQRPIAEAAPDLPSHLPVGYHLDLPLTATRLTRQIAKLPWFGLFCAFDYGKSWHELTHECPQGTLRAYHSHRQSTDLLAHPGEQDLTCHICWDWLVDSLQNNRFETAPVLSQEAFFVKNAPETLAAIMSAEAGRMSPRKAGLLQLLHPSALCLLYTSPSPRDRG